MNNIIISLIRDSFSSATPILLAALGGTFTFYANVFNIAMEGMMLIGAFFAVLGSYFFQSWLIGVLFALISGAITALIFSLFALYLKTDEFLTGIGINMLALGGTTYLLRNIFNVKGAFISPQIQSMPKWDIPVLKRIPILNEILNNHPFIVYITIILAILIDLIIFHTKFGLRLRATGEDKETARSLGVNPYKMKFVSILLSGILSSAAGTFLSLGYVTLFSENMSNGRGWISLAIIVLVKGRPLGILLISLIFGFFESVAFSLQHYNIPSQITSMIPYIITLVALFIYSFNKTKKEFAEQ
ncbi:ABC transporter permease [Petrotoga sp. 9PW.55.5.1]|uniref:ABC transporter permease n=1 Tax=Petrotoga sp. 9PW.55.5.1 TaxID=1308979 RepID=UPI000DC4CB7D|nr:ABC transporter permease [Petrotoga sp. 9PW.55.5.1]RAO99794.1 ABC transporter permease [Petrotoga sp. 9PW.55.5.1]